MGVVENGREAVSLAVRETKVCLFDVVPQDSVPTQFMQHDAPVASAPQRVRRVTEIVQLKVHGPDSVRAGIPLANRLNIVSISMVHSYRKRRAVEIGR